MIIKKPCARYSPEKVKGGWKGIDEQTGLTPLRNSKEGTEDRCLARKEESRDEVSEEGGGEETESDSKTNADSLDSFQLGMTCSPMYF